jgi:hypothetical protein
VDLHPLTTLLPYFRDKRWTPTVDRKCFYEVDEENGLVSFILSVPLL